MTLVMTSQDRNQAHTIIIQSNNNRRNYYQPHKETKGNLVRDSKDHESRFKIVLKEQRIISFSSNICLVGWCR